MNQEKIQTCYRWMALASRTELEQAIARATEAQAGLLPLLERLVDVGEAGSTSQKDPPGCWGGTRSIRMAPGAGPPRLRIQLLRGLSYRRQI